MRFTDQLNGFCMKRFFTESSLLRDFSKIGFGLGKCVFEGREVVR